MTLNQLTALVIRITGIIILIYATRNTIAWFSVFNNATNNPNLWLALTPIAMMISAAFCMIIFPSIVASNITPESSEIPEEQGFEIDRLEKTICSLVGLYFLIKAVTNISYYIIYWFALQRDEIFNYNDTLQIFTPQNIADLSATALELALALWLLFGAKGLIQILKWARNINPSPK